MLSTIIIDALDYAARTHNITGELGDNRVRRMLKLFKSNDMKSLKSLLSNPMTTRSQVVKFVALAK